MRLCVECIVVEDLFSKLLLYYFYTSVKSIYEAVRKTITDSINKSIPESTDPNTKRLDKN